MSSLLLPGPSFLSFQSSKHPTLQTTIISINFSDPLFLLLMCTYPSVATIKTRPLTPLILLWPHPLISSDAHWLSWLTILPVMILISPVTVAINSHWHPDLQDSLNLQPLPYLLILLHQQPNKYILMPPTLSSSITLHDSSMSLHSTNGHH